MSPKEKASALINNFKTYSYVAENEDHECQTLLWNAKMCARMCVEEIIEANPYYFYPGRRVTRFQDHSTKEYWEEVKKEINKYKE